MCGRALLGKRNVGQSWSAFSDVAVFVFQCQNSSDDCDHYD